MHDTRYRIRDAGCGMREALWRRIEEVMEG